MKKRKLLIPLAVMALSVGVTVGMTGCKDDPTPKPEPCETHVDADKNGICDVCGETVEIPATTGTVKLNPASNGTVTADKTTYNLGDTVTITVTPKADYRLKKLTVNGVDKTADVAEGKLVLADVQETALSVFATFEAKEVNFTVNVKGHKQNEEVSLAGATLSLSDGGAGDPYTAEVGADGSATFENVKIGNYTLSAEGYLETKVSVDASGTAVNATLEYGRFKEVLHWGQFDFTKMNDDTAPEFGINNDCAAIFTNETYDEVMASVYLNGTGFASGNTGILFRFVGDGLNDLVTVRMEGTKKVQFSNHPLWTNVGATHGIVVAEGTDWQDLIFFETTGEGKADANAEKYLSEYEEGTLKLSVYRKGATFYVFLDDVYIGQRTFNEKYANAKVEAGFLAENLKNENEQNDTTSWKRWKVDITEKAPALSAKAQITVEKPEDAEAATANVVADTSAGETFAFGSKIKLTVTKPVGYKLESLTVNGIDMADGVENNAIEITANRATMEIKAKFVKEEPIALNITVKGKKLGTTEVLAKDTVVTFKGTDYSFTVGENGVISNNAVAKGKYTVSVNGYLEQQITFDENTTEVVLEYNTFKQILGWGQFDFSKQNEATPELGFNNDCAVFLTNDTYSSVQATIYMKGTNMTKGEAGLVFRFVGDGLNEKGETVVVMMQETKKVQFAENNLWGNTTVATGNKWNNLIYFQDIFDDGENRTADEHSAEYLEAYNKGELKFSVVRKGTTFYVFLNDRLIGMQEVDAKYANAKCEAGFVTGQLQDAKEWKFWNVEISGDVTLPSYTVSNGTAEDANGSLTGIPADKVEVGDTVTLTISAQTGYKLSALKVNGKDVTAQVTGTTYSFVVTENVSVTAEFTQIVPGSINAPISGNKFGVDGNSLSGSESVTLSASGFDDVTAALTSEGDDVVLSVASIAAGTWTVTVDGYQTAEITVEENGEYTAAIVLKPVEEFTLIKGWGTLNSVIASDGSASLTITDGQETAVSKTQYRDIAVSVYLSGANMVKEGSTGTQGIVLRFSDGKLAVLRMEGRAKIQFAYTSTWFMPDSADGTGWQDLIFFTDDGDTTVKDKYLTAFDKGELKLTAVRKGATIYAVLTVDGVSEVIGCRTFADGYLNDNVKVGMYCENTTGGAAKTWKFEVGDADAALATATPAVGEDKVSYLGAWTENEGTLAVAGNGLIEFKAAAGTVKESVTMTLASKNAESEQGLIYRFADGKYVAIRYQKTNDGAKIQFTMDTVLFTNASLASWTDYAMTEAEITAFNGDGISLTFVRDANKFYAVLGDRVLGTYEADETKYASADGNMGIMMWKGSNSAFAYEHKTGDDVTVPTVSDEGETA